MEIYKNFVSKGDASFDALREKSTDATRVYHTPLWIPFELCSIRLLSLQNHGRYLGTLGETRIAKHKIISNLSRTFDKTISISSVSRARGTGREVRTIRNEFERSLRLISKVKINGTAAVSAHRVQRRRVPKVPRHCHSANYSCVPNSRPTTSYFR